MAGPVLTELAVGLGAVENVGDFVGDGGGVGSVNGDEDFGSGDRAESEDGEDAAGVDASVAGREVDGCFSVAAGGLGDLAGGAGVEVFGQDDGALGGVVGDP